MSSDTPPPDSGALDSGAPSQGALVVPETTLPDSNEFETALKTVQAQPWWDTWMTKFGEVVGSVLGKPSITEIAMQLNGLRYSKWTTLPALARRIADFAGGAGSADLLRATAARIAMIQHTTKGLTDETFISLLFASIGRMIDRLDKFREERLKTRIVTPGSEARQTAESIRIQQKHAAGVLAEVATGMAICAEWFRETYPEGKKTSD